MNGCIQAECISGVWHLVRQRAQSLSPHDELQVRQSLQAGRAKAQEMYRSLGSCSGVWQLEFSKAALDEGEIALGLAAQFAQQCCDNPDVVHSIRAPARHLSLRSLVRALQARGQRVAWSWAYPTLDIVQFVLAIGVAGVFWIGTVLRSIGESAELPKQADFLIAAHGEWTNRTRHVLALGAAGQAQPTIIVLGRPKVSLKALARIWSEQLGCGPLKLVRPFSLLAAALSLPRAARIFFKGGRLISQQPYKPSFAEQVATAYRCFLGAASASWWPQQRSALERVVYGHTGLADTTLLEQAQQQAGVQTIHAVHGISAGLNFTGRSSIGLFLCEHDARWHEQLGGYGSCRSYVAVRPEHVPGRSGMLFLSNHAHPMNLWFRAFGPADELKALSIMAEAADDLGMARSEVVWKPHPVFNTLDVADREVILQKIRSLGLRLWKEGASLQDSVQFQHVVCTRSTVALDVLRLGVLPIILDTRLENNQDVMSVFPYQADNAAGLSSAARLLMDSANPGSIFASLWSKIGPALAVSLSQCLPESNTGGLDDLYLACDPRCSLSPPK